MPESDFTTLAAPSKPSKPYPEFPHFPHATSGKRQAPRDAKCDLEIA